LEDRRNVGKNSCNSGDRRNQTGPILDVDDDDKYSALGPVWAESRAQSGDWYGSGMLHPGQVLRCSLPLDLLIIFEL